MTISVQLQYQQILSFLYQQILLKGITEQQQMHIWLSTWLSNLSDLDQATLFDILKKIPPQDQTKIKLELLNRDDLVHTLAITQESRSQMIDFIRNDLKLFAQDKSNLTTSNSETIVSAFFQRIISVELNPQKVELIASSIPRIPRFQIKSFLGEGQSAKVYLAVDLMQSPMRVCALKVGLLVDPMRFQREVEYMKKISHPNVLKCWDAAQFEEKGVQKYWLCMPNLGGVNLEDLIIQNQLKLKTKIEVLQKVLNGLCALHEKNIVHRDLKPGNCLISMEGEVLLSDFGLSIQEQTDTKNLVQTMPFNLIGTPAYMSPEQAKGQNNSISYQSDVWSFGIMIYELLLGDLPWGREINYFQMLGNIQHLDVPLTKFDALGMPKMKALLEKCLNREMSARYSNAMALKTDFLKVCQEEMRTLQVQQAELTRKVLQEKKVLDKYFQLALLKGDDFSVPELLRVIRSSNIKDELDLEELNKIIDQAKQLLKSRYFWKDDYLKKLASYQTNLKNLDEEKKLAQKTLMLQVNQRKSTLPANPSEVQQLVIQQWQRIQEDEIEDRFSKKYDQLENQMEIDRAKFKPLVSALLQSIWLAKGHGNQANLMNGGTQVATGSNQAQGTSNVQGIKMDNSGGKSAKDANQPNEGGIWHKLMVGVFLFYLASFFFKLDGKQILEIYFGSTELLFNFFKNVFGYNENLLRLLQGKNNTLDLFFMGLSIIYVALAISLANILYLIALFHYYRKRFFKSRMYLLSIFFIVLLMFLIFSITDLTNINSSQIQLLMIVFSPYLSSLIIAHIRAKSMTQAQIAQSQDQPKTLSRVFSIILVVLSIDLISMTTLYIRAQMKEIAQKEKEKDAEIKEKDAAMKKLALINQMNFVFINGGSFDMGSSQGNLSETPVHWVHVSDFSISRAEVTVAQYQQCVDAGQCTEAHWDDHTCEKWNGSWQKTKMDGNLKKDQRPIACIDWLQARTFAYWVGGDLPTEAQWEYAATSGGKASTYPWGNDTPNCSRANFYNCHSTTTDVCDQTAGNTMQGLCDMGGNVSEWLLDEWHHSYENAPNHDRGWCNSSSCNLADNGRIVRGGSWTHDQFTLRSSFRENIPENTRRSVIGFRVVKKH